MPQLAPSPSVFPRPDLEQLRVLVVDDHLAVAQALAGALSSQEDMEVLGCAATPWEARDLLNGPVDVALVDVDMGHHDGFALARELTELRPGLRLIVMSDRPQAQMLESVISMGARGYVNKSQGLQQIVDAVRQARHDHIAIPVSLFADMTSRAYTRTERTRATDKFRELLTERELEILTLMADGMSTKDLAAHLVLSVHTVRSHAQNTLTKLGVSSRLQAVAKARAAGVFGDPVSAAASAGGARVERRRSG